MSRYGDDGIDFSDAFDRLVPNASAAPAASAPKAVTSRFTPNVSAARPPPSRSGVGHPPPGGFAGAPSAASAPPSSAALGFMSRPRPPVAAPAASGGQAHASSLPPQPAWLQRAYNAPASSPLSTHRQTGAGPNAAAAVPVRPNTSPHFANGGGGMARTGSFSGGVGGSAHPPPQRQQSGSGVRFTTGSNPHTPQNTAGGAFHNGLNQAQQQRNGAGAGAGSFQSTYGYQPPGQQQRGAPASRRGRGGGGPARPVAFPANFNPNAAPPLPPSSASLAPGSGAAAGGSKYRTMYEPSMSDVPKGRARKKNDLGIPLPDYLQQYANTPRHKLPDSLSSDDRSLLRAERKRLRVHEAERNKSLSQSRKQAELIDLDAYSAEVQRERKGWNSQRIKVSFQLCSADRVAVETNPRNEMRIIHMVQSVQGAAFDRNLASSSSSGGGNSRNNDGFGSKGLWTIPISAYDAALARLVGLRSDHLDIVIVPVDPNHLRALRGESALQKQHTSFESMRGIPPALAASLYPFQRAGVEYCVNHEGRAMIGDEMGLGKSIQAIAVAAYYSDDWPLLIVCPSSLRLTWKNELLKWLGISSLRESDVLEVSSGEEDEDEGRIPDDFGEDGEAEWAPSSTTKPKSKSQSQITADDFLDDDEDFERLVASTAGGAAATAAAPKRGAKAAARSASPVDDGDEDEDAGENEYQPPTTRKGKSSSRTAAAASKKRRRIVDSDEEEEEESDVEIPDSDASWDEDDNASEDEEEEADEAYEPEPVVTRKKPPKRRRIIDDSDEEEEEEEEAEPAAAAAAAEEEDDDEVEVVKVKVEETPIATRSSAASSLTPKEAFKAKLAARAGGQPAQPSKPAPSSEDAELQESLRLIAEMEEREAAKRRDVKTESGASVRIKTEPSSSMAEQQREEEDDVVDMCVDGDEPVKSEPAGKAEAHVSVKAEPQPPVVAPYVSASSLIKPSFSLDDMRVKTEPQYAPAPTSATAAAVAKKPAPIMPSPSPPIASPTPSPAPPRASPTARASSSAAASSASSAAYAAPVKPSSSSSSINGVPPLGPSFRPLTKNNIHVILTGKAPLMGPASSQTRVVIISYDLVAKYTLALQRQNFQFIIADESHAVKNATAKRSQALLPLLESAKRALCLSGTPAMSRPYELYPQINALRPTVFGSAHAFGTRYCAPTKGFRGKIEYKGAQNLVELHMLLKKYVLVRRLKEDVLKDLRPKTRTVIVTSAHDKALADNIRQIANIKQIVAAQVVTDGAARPSQAAAMAAAASANGGPKKQITQLYADTGLAKLPFILSYLQDLLEAGTKFLIFAHHLAVLDGIEQCLIKEKAGYFRLDGSTKPADRQAGVERFQTDPTCRVALLSITAGGTGITLTAASTVVFAELQWTPALLCQAEDRVHRIGQFNPVNIYYIVAHHTLDEILWPMLSNKLEVLGNTLNGREDQLAVAGVRGDAAMHTPITFKKAAPQQHEAVDLTDGDGDADEHKADTDRTPTAQPQRRQQADSFRTSIKTEEPASAAAAAATAPKAAPFSGWIGMSGGGAKKEPFGSAPLPSPSAPKPVVSLAAQLGAAGSVARLLQRDASLDAELHSTQQEQRMARSVQEDVERFRLPMQQGERDLRHSQHGGAIALDEAASQVAPPPDALISLEIADSDAEYASDRESGEEEEEQDPDVFDTAAARRQLERSRRQQQ